MKPSNNFGVLEELDSLKIFKNAAMQISVILLFSVCLLQSCCPPGGCPPPPTPAPPPTPVQSISYAFNAACGTLNSGRSPGHTYKAVNIHPNKSVKFSTKLVITGSKNPFCPYSKVINLGPVDILTDYILKPNQSINLSCDQSTCPSFYDPLSGICYVGGEPNCACDGYWCNDVLTQLKFEWTTFNACWVDPGTNQCESIPTTPLTATEPIDPTVKRGECNGKCLNCNIYDYGAIDLSLKQTIKEYYFTLLDDSKKNYSFVSDLSKFSYAVCMERKSELITKPLGKTLFSSVGPSCTATFNFPSKVPFSSGSTFDKGYLIFSPTIKGEVKRTKNTATIELEYQFENSIYAQIYIEPSLKFQNDIIKKIYIDKVSKSILFEGDYLCFTINNLPPD
jgi:hypothetical protein